MGMGIGLGGCTAAEVSEGGDKDVGTGETDRDVSGKDEGDSEGDV